MFIKTLYIKNLIDNNQHYDPDNIIYETIVGSRAYGINTETSDVDIFSIVVPDINQIFSYKNGYIDGFGTRPPKFEQYHNPKVEYNNSIYDIKIYSIVKFFDLCFRSNPDIIDSVFVPHRCYIHDSEIFNIIYNNRFLFLSNQLIHKIRHYAYSNLLKIKTPVATGESKKHLIEKYGYDVKTGSHIVRLMIKAKQILTLNTIDLEMESYILKDIRNGKWSVEDIEKYFQTSEKELEILLQSSILPDAPDEVKIKKVLIHCLNTHYKELCPIKLSENGEFDVYST